MRLNMGMNEHVLFHHFEKTRTRNTIAHGCNEYWLISTRKSGAPVIDVWSHAMYLSCHIKCVAVRFRPLEWPVSSASLNAAISLCNVFICDRCFHPNRLPMSPVIPNCAKDARKKNRICIIVNSKAKQSATRACTAWLDRVRNVFMN